MPTLTVKGLCGQFIRYLEHRGDVYLLDVMTLAEAQGISMLCPRCFGANGGRITTHSVTIWFADRDVPDWARPTPGRWEATGTGLADLTLTPSVIILGGCTWQGEICDGTVVG